MRLVIYVIILLFIAAFNTSRAYAIVFLPAIVLIPIAKIVALIIGGFSIPALGVGTIWSKLFGKPLNRIVTIVVFSLIILGVLVGIFLKMQNPERPLF